MREEGTKEQRGRQRVGGEGTKEGSMEGTKEGSMEDGGMKKGR